MSYKPELWCVLRITPKGENTWYRLFAMWRGGFATSDEWRANSGITRIEENGEFYYVYGESGSCYICDKRVEQMDPPGYFGTVIAGFFESAKGKAEIEIVSVKQAIEEMQNA